MDKKGGLRVLETGQGETERRGKQESEVEERGNRVEREERESKTGEQVVMSQES